MTYPVTAAGLAVPVLIGLDSKAIAVLRAAGLRIPPPIRARGLLDTCSDLSGVTAAVLQQLPIPPTTTASTHTAAGPARVRIFEVSVSILGPAPSGAFLMTEPDVLVSELPSLPDADVLIGLDLLLKGNLLLEGLPRQFTLDF